MVETAPGQTEKQTGATVDYLIIRRSALFLGTQIVALELISVVIVLVLQFADNLAVTTSGLAGIGGLLTVALIVGLLVKLWLILWIVLAWINDYYEIRPAEIICHRGIFSAHKTILSTKEVKSITVDQDLLGRVFRYGDLRLFNPALDEVIALTNIANPNKHLAIIQQLLPQLEQGTTFIRQSTGVGP